MTRRNDIHFKKIWREPEQTRVNFIYHLYFSMILKCMKSKDKVNESEKGTTESYCDFYNLNPNGTRRKKHSLFTVPPSYQNFEKYRP